MSRSVRFIVGVSVLVALFSFAIFVVHARETRPIADAKALVMAKVLPLWGMGRLIAFKPGEAGLVCGGYQLKDPDGKFMAPETFIVRFQTVTWRGWYDPILLRPTQGHLVFHFGDPAQDAAIDAQARQATAKDFASNDYYRYAPTCDAAPNKPPLK